METRELAHADVYPNPHQPRTVFEQRPLEELAASIDANGLIQPIEVVPDGKGRWMIVVGERRWRAHGLLGRRTIRATIAEGLSSDDVADRAIVENLQRRDITPLEEARAFQRRLDAGLTVEELAKRLGLKQPWRITERTNLLRLDPTFQDALARGILTPSQAQEMSRLSPTGQRILFDAIGDGKCGTYAELRRVSDALVAKEQQCDMFAPPAPPTEEEAERATRLERAVDAAARALAAGFDGNDCVALRRVRPARAEVMREQLAIIERGLKEIRLSLTAACVAR